MAILPWDIKHQQNCIDYLTIRFMGAFALWFYGCDTSAPIVIRGTFKDIPPKLISEDNFGLFLCKPHILLETGENDERENGKDFCLTIELAIDGTLEPKWEIVCNRKEANAITFEKVHATNADQMLLFAKKVRQNTFFELIN